MTERSRGEEEAKPESLEKQKYAAMLAADAEKDRIMEEIDRVLSSTADRLEAEKIVLKTWAPQMDEAMRVAGQAYDEWAKVMKEDIAAHEREIGK